MGALAKRRISTYRRGKRRAGHIAPIPALNKCPKCGNLKRPHFVCGHCAGESKSEK
ncbi:MAG: 50S ribosomal protein L32 [Patescibacteria group bacterium]